MDLLFKKYASPFLFLDFLVETGDLEDGIDVIINQNQDEKDWELYLSLNPWNDKSYFDWKKEKYKNNSINTTTTNLSKEDAKTHFDTEYNKSQQILNNFNPLKKKEGE